MKNKFIRTRRARYGGMTILLTVLLIAAIVLANALFSTLAKRYSWYADMRGEIDFSVSERCYELLGSVLNEQTAPVEIIFCDTEQNIAEEITSSNVYDTAKSIAERFEGKVKISCHNIWLNPDSVRKYTTTLNPATGEMVDTSLKSTSVIIVNGSYYRVYNLTEFFTFADGDTSNMTGYNGERKLAAGILHAVSDGRTAVCLTNNHGEIFYDYELLYLLDDAGYEIHYIDLYTDPIPANCRLIVSYNPNSDLTVNDGISAKSETAVLNDFLSVSGNSFLVFLENGTPSLPNLEAFLADWGVQTCYYTNKTTNASFRYMVQDATQSLTSDGYTIYGSPAAEGEAASYVKDLTRGTVFKNATALRAANGFVNNNDGSYTKDNRTMYSLFTAGESAVSWANGAAVDDQEATLFALTKQTNADAGASYVGVSSSVDMMSENFLQSAVHGNSDTMLHLFEQFGQSTTPKGLNLKPVQSTTISTATTSQMWRWTVVLAVLPAVVLTAAGVLVLVRRRRA